MKKLLSVCLAVCMVAGLITVTPLTVSAAEVKSKLPTTTSATRVSVPITTQTISQTDLSYFAVKDDGSLWAWGYAGEGSLGNGKDQRDYPVRGDWGAVEMAPVKTINGAVKSVFGSSAIKDDNSFWRWGAEPFATRPEMYNDYKGFSNVPAKIMDDVQHYSSVIYHSNYVDNSMYMYIKTDGSLWVFGSGEDQSGFLGDGTQRERRTTPVKILDNVAYASFGRPSLALTRDGTLYAWGTKSLGSAFNNNYVQYALSSTGIVPVNPNAPIEERFWLRPQKVMDGVISFRTHSLSDAVFIVMSDNTLWAWGDNYRHPVMTDVVPRGNEHDVFYKIMDNVRSVDVADIGNAVLAVKTDNSLWTWGYCMSSSLALGDWPYPREDRVGDYTRAEPKKIMDNVAVTSGCTALKLDGSLWAWGNALQWPIGTGKYDWYPGPVKIMDGVRIPSLYTPQPNPPVLIAKPTNSTVLVNGENVVFDAYNINDSNYFKLRDLAYVLSGTEKQFEASWDGVNNAIVLTSGKPYTALGGEMTGKGAGDKTPTLTNSKIIMDGKEAHFTAYNIEGNNYFKLRDIGAAFDFGVEWDGARNTIVIDTSKGYTPE